MRAAIIDRAGSAPRYGEFADPDPAAGETVMEVVAAGIHPLVRGLAAGSHYGSTGEYPLVPGVDCVARDDAGVLRYAGFVRAPWGTLAQRAAVRMGLPLPEGADPVCIAGALNPGLSSWMPLTDRLGQVASLGTVLIVGATGVAGRIAVQNAFSMGATRVVGAGRDEARLAEIAARGAVPVRLGDGPDGIARALDGTAPSIVLDYAWGSAAETVWDALGRRGLEEDTADILHVEIGGMAGPKAALPAALLRSRRITVRGSGAGSASIEAVMAQLPIFMAKVAAGEVVPPVRSYPLSQVAHAWADDSADRIVVVPD